MRMFKASDLPGTIAVFPLPGALLLPRDLRSSWEHCSDIVKEAEAQGFRNILCPSSSQVGQDTLSFVAGCAPITEKINMLAAVRCGEMQPIMLARTIATLDHMLQGRLTVNIISSEFPGEKVPSPSRYQRSVMDISRPEFERARGALSDEWDREAVFIGMGGSIPIAGFFKSILGMESMLIGFAAEDDQIHSPNEKYDVQSFHKGIRSWARVLDALTKG